MDGCPEPMPGQGAGLSIPPMVGERHPLRVDAEARGAQLDVAPRRVGLHHARDHHALGALVFVRDGAGARCQGAPRRRGARRDPPRLHLTTTRLYLPTPSRSAPRSAEIAPRAPDGWIRRGRLSPGRLESTRGEREERALLRPISGIQRKYETRERDERAERRRSCKRLHQKGEREEGKRGRLISIQRHRAR